MENVDIGLSSSEMKKLVDVLSTQPHIEKAIVYGSRAMGTNRRFSDIDLTLVGEKLTIHDMNRVALLIDDLLLPYQLDLSLYSSLTNTALIDHINRVGKVIYKS